MTEGPSPALAAPAVLAIADTVAKTVQTVQATVEALRTVQVAWVPSMAGARAGVPPAGLVGKLVHDRAPVLGFIAVKIYRDMFSIYR